MTENPYRPTNTQFASSSNQSAIRWKLVFIACAIGFIGGCVLGALWGFVGFCVYLLIGSSANAFYQGPIASVLGWCVGLIPFVLGLFYICHAIDDSRIVNCLLVALFSVLTAVPFIFLDEDPFDWTFCLYFLLQFLLAAIVAAVWNRRQS
jgi:hypothetical protein